MLRATDYIEMGVFLAVLLLLGIVVLLMRDSVGRTSARREVATGRAPPGSSRRARTNAWEEVTMLAFIGILVVALQTRMAIWGMLAPFLGAALVISHVRVLPNRHGREAFRLARSGHVDEAIELARKRVEKRPCSPEDWGTLGLVLLAGERWDEALEALDRQEALGAPGWATLNNRGLALWKLGRLEDAIAALDQALAQATGEASVLCNRCLVLADLGRLDEARNALAALEMIARKPRMKRCAAREWMDGLLAQCRRRVSDGPRP